MASRRGALGQIGLLWLGLLSAGAGCVLDVSVQKDATLDCERSPMQQCVDRCLRGETRIGEQCVPILEDPDAQQGLTPPEGEPEPLDASTTPEALDARIAMDAAPDAVAAPLPDAGGSGEVDATAEDAAPPLDEGSPCEPGQELVEDTCIPVCPGGMVRLEGEACAPPGYERIEHGPFQMGTQQTNQPSPRDESPQHRVVISRSLWMKSKPVTTGEWVALMDSHPSNFSRRCGDTCPVESVNWYEALTYANALSASHQLSACYVLENCRGELGGGLDGLTYRCALVTPVEVCTGYRLPTEAEWEYARRAGQTEGSRSDVEGRLDEIAWYSNNAGGRTQPVGLKHPNAWGLYDMAGNVFEWVWDIYEEGYYRSSPELDPQGPEGQTEQIRGLRGGCWNSDTEDLRPSARAAEAPVGRANTLGFRLVRAVVE